MGLVKSGMVVSLGTGSTLSLVFEELGKLIREGKVWIFQSVAVSSLLNKLDKEKKSPSDLSLKKYYII